MSLCRNLGRLLVTIDDATHTLFDDNAFVTVIEPNPRYKEDGVLLNIVVEILKNRYDNEEEYNTRRRLLDELIYNPMIHTDFTLSKVDITFVER